MARILLGSYMVRYPLGGMMSWVLQYLVGFHRLGHEIYLVEKSGYANACYDPIQDVMTNSCTYGAKVVDDLLNRFDLAGRWCYVDEDGRYHGMQKQRVTELFSTADVFIDMGTHGSWLDEASSIPRKVLIDGEPGFTQIKMQKRLDGGGGLAEYDYYFTTGQNIGTKDSPAPTASKTWHHLFHPVVVDLFSSASCDDKAMYTTVMNWQSYEPVEFQGTTFHHKDREFEQFIELPRCVDARLEIAVSGKRVPHERLNSSGWKVNDAHQVTKTYDAFVDYVNSSRGEFSVCKNGFVATNSGWFSDRSAVYLASGRPVVLQDTGYSRVLPTGRGLFSPSTLEEAADAIRQIEANHATHALAARDLAHEYLSADKVLSQLLEEVCS